MAERVGFEPTVPTGGTSVFETDPIDRSGTSPRPGPPYTGPPPPAQRPSAAAPLTPARPGGYKPAPPAAPSRRRRPFPAVQRSRSARGIANPRQHRQGATNRGRRMNFAVIRTGGKQYRVTPNAVLTVEKLAAEPGSTITF